MAIHPELARDLADLSLEIGRQAGLLANRAGEIEYVVIGDNRGIELPALERPRGALTRLSGLRWIHTHLHDEGINRDDLNDLASLRLDLIAALIVQKAGHPPAFDAAYILPSRTGETGVGRLSAPHAGALDLDFRNFIEELEAELSREQRQGQAARQADRAILVSVSALARAEIEERLDELAELARTAGLHVQDRLVFRPRDTKSRQMLGLERVRNLNLQAIQTGVDLIVFEQNLSPSQMNWLADQTELRILDRTQLILDIFAQRAQSREGKLQVEMAQLKYIQPRLTQKNTGMSRLTGGIGARGPGETKLEINRRRVRERIARLKTDLELVKTQRGLHRAQRARAGIPIVSIVGYTNAGKSTLLNNLTHSEVLAEDKLFATLDPTSRRLKFPKDRQIVLTDTVGFIRDLPPDLIDAFSATLEELSSADLLLHVIDASGANLDRQVETVENLLADLDLADVPRQRVLNKIDKVDPALAENLARRFEAVAISARDRKTFPPLIEAICRRFEWTEQCPVELLVEEPETPDPESSDDGNNPVSA